MSSKQFAGRFTVALAAAGLIAACALPFRSLWAGKKNVAVYRLAVLPLERGTEQAARTSGEAGGLAPDAEKVVTAQVYGVLASRSRFVFAPDLAAEYARASLRPDASLVERARALGRATKSDAVLCGRVFRFVERAGTEREASRPASVSFVLKLVLVETGAVVWEERFDETQESSGAGRFTWWMFWRQQQRWLSARELARAGVERLMAAMEDEVS